MKEEIFKRTIYLYIYFCFRSCCCFFPTIFMWIDTADVNNLCFNYLPCQLKSKTKTHSADKVSQQTKTETNVLDNWFSILLNCGRYILKLAQNHPSNTIIIDSTKIDNFITNIINRAFLLFKHLRIRNVTLFLCIHSGKKVNMYHENAQSIYVNLRTCRKLHSWLLKCVCVFFFKQKILRFLLPQFDV